MKTYLLFESFVKMIRGISASAIPEAIELQQKMLENDLHRGIVKTMEETASILSFCQFIKTALRSNKREQIRPIELPAKHIAFYREVVIRLINAGKLSADVKKQFDATYFSSGKRTSADEFAVASAVSSGI